MPSFLNKIFKNMLPTQPIHYSSSRFTWVLLNKDVHIKHITGVTEEIIISAFQLYYTEISNICMYSLVIPLDFASPKSRAGRMPHPQQICNINEFATSISSIAKSINSSAISDLLL